MCQKSARPLLPRPRNPQSPGLLPSLLLALLLTAGVAHAQPTLQIGSGAGRPGSTVDVPVSVGQPAGVVALQFDLTYDSTALTVGTLRPGPSLQDHVLDWATVAPGRLRVVLTSASRSAVSPGVLWTVPFRVQATAPVGDLALDVESVVLGDASAAAVAPASVGPGQVRVVSSGAPLVIPTLGVWGSVALAALLVLAASFFLRAGGGGAGGMLALVLGLSLAVWVGKEVHAQTMPGDANGDGSVNAADIPTIVDEILQRGPAPGDADCNGDTRVDVLDTVCVALPGPGNVAPVLQPIGNLTVPLGQTLAVTLTASDADGDPLRFGALPLPLPAPATLDAVSGAFSFRPDPSQVGNFDVTFTVSDGVAVDSELVTVTVVDPGGGTALSGRILDANDAVSGVTTPIVGVTVSLLGTGLSTVSGPSGHFSLPGAPSGKQILDLDVATASPGPGGVFYAGFREALPLIPGVDNVIDRPFYLPRLDNSSRTTVDPTQTTFVTNAALGVTLEVPPASARNPDGSLFVGELTISEVPDALAPAPLPGTLQPGLLITIQPVGVTFNPPAPVTFPNRDGNAPGNETNLWSLDPNEGAFAVVGTGSVQANGTIPTVSGGVRAADWHFMLPPDPDDRRTTDDDARCLGCCGPAGSVAGSWVELKRGVLSEEILLPAYMSTERAQGVTLRYDSMRAYPSSLQPLDLTIPRRAAVPAQISYEASLGGVKLGLPVFVDTSGLSETVDETLRVSMPVDTSALGTGIYRALLRTTSHYGASSVSSLAAREITVVNESQSPLGAGWSVAGLSRLVPQKDETLLIDGDGRSLHFPRGANGDVAIVMHLFSPEISNLQSYLTEMGLNSTVFLQPGTTPADLAPFDVIVFDGVCCIHGGFAATVDLFEQMEQAGKALYFINDDLATQANALAEPQASTWERLTHLVRTSDTGLSGTGSGRVDLAQPLHPVLGGPFGSVQPFDYGADSDRTVATGTGESTLATIKGAPVVLAIEESSGRRTVTQNILAASGYFAPQNVAEAKKLFQNAIRWLLDANAAATGAHRSPLGDTSVLVENANGTFTRTTKDGVVDQYDAQGLLSQTVDRNGNTTSYSYDGAGRLTQITDPVGFATTFSYAGGQLDTITGPAGRVTSFSHDAAGNLVQVTLPDGTSRAFTYDARHLLVAQTDEAGFQTRYQYDPYGRLVASDWPDGSRRTMTSLQKAGLVDPTSGLGTQASPAPVVRPAAAQSALTDGEGRTFVMRGDRFGQAASNTDPGGTQSTKTLAPGGPTETSVSPSGHVRRATYDALGNLLTATDEAVNGTATFTYEPVFNQLTTATDPFGATTTLAYDAFGNLTSVTTPAGRAISLTYTPSGLVQTATDRAGTVTQLSYDGRNRVVGTTRGSGGGARSASLSYTPEGLMASVTDPEGRVMSFTHDQMGRPRTTVLPDGEVIATTYDARGQVVAVTPPGRPAHRFTYDETGQRASYRPPDVGGAAVTRFTYNDAQQIVQIDRPDGRSVVRTYDGAGRLATRQLGRGSSSFAYDPTSGQLVSVTAPGGEDLALSYLGDILNGESWSGTVSGSVSRTYDAAFRLASEEVNGAQQVTYTYDADHLLTQAGALTASRDAASGRIVSTTVGHVDDTRSYNQFGEQVGYSASFGGTPLYSYTLTRDRLGRVVGESETVQLGSSSFVYTYDARGRLERVDQGGALAARYTYDANGNRLSRVTTSGTETGSYDAQDRPTAYGGASFTHRESGELASRTDASGTTTYDYDEMGQLLSVTLPTGRVVSYVLDGADRRIAKRIDGTLTQGFLYGDELNVVAELDGTGGVRSRFVYGTSGHVPDYMLRGGSVYRILSDQVGSVRLVVDTATGAVAQRIDYDAFGRITLDTSPGFQPFGFAGGLYDPDTGLVRFGARDYDPQLGRWTARDPILFDGGTTNLYAYVGSAPLDRIDPSGLQDSSRAIGRVLFVQHWDPQQRRQYVTRDTYALYRFVGPIREGGVAFAHRGGRVVQLREGDAVYPGDRIVTREGSPAEIEFDIGGRAYLPEGSRTELVGERSARGLRGSDGRLDRELVRLRRIHDLNQYYQQPRFSQFYGATIEG